MQQSAGSLGRRIRLKASYPWQTTAAPGQMDSPLQYLKNYGEDLF